MEEINGYKVIKLITKREKRNVYEVTKDNSIYICKQFYDDFIFLQEFNMIIKFNHKNIIKIKDVFKTKSLDLNYKDDAYCIIYDFYEMTLEQKLKDHDVTNELKKKWIFQLIDIVNYIHSKNIVHLDIKADNIMFDKHNNIILIDFGRACYEGSDNLFESISNNWYPPEHNNINKDIKIFKSSDIWMLGNNFDYIKLKNKDFDLLIDNMMKENEKDRPTIFDVINSNYFKNNYDINNLTKYKLINEFKDNESKDESENDESLIISNLFIGMNEKMVKILSDYMDETIDNFLYEQDSIKLKYKKFVDIFIYNNFDTLLKINKIILQLFGLSLLYIVVNTIYYTDDDTFLMFYDGIYTQLQFKSMIEKLINIIYKEKNLFYPQDIIEFEKNDIEYEIKYFEEYPDWFYILNFDETNDIIINKLLEMNIKDDDYERLSKIPFRSEEYLELTNPKQKDKIITLFTCLDSDNIILNYLNLDIVVCTKINQVKLKKESDKQIIEIINQSSNFENIYLWLDTLNMKQFKKVISKIHMDKLFDNGYFTKKIINNKIFNIFEHDEFKYLLNHNFIHFILINYDFIEWCILEENEKLNLTKYIKYFADEIIDKVFKDLGDDFPQKENYNIILEYVNKIKYNVKKEHIKLLLFYIDKFEKCIIYLNKN